MIEPKKRKGKMEKRFGASAQRYIDHVPVIVIGHRDRSVSLGHGEEHLELCYLPRFHICVLNFVLSWSGRIAIPSTDNVRFAS